MSAGVAGTYGNPAPTLSEEIEELRNRIIALEEINRSLADEQETYREFMQREIDLLKGPR